MLLSKYLLKKYGINSTNYTIAENNKIISNVLNNNALYVAGNSNGHDYGSIGTTIYAEDRASHDIYKHQDIGIGVCALSIGHNSIRFEDIEIHITPDTLSSKYNPFESESEKEIKDKKSKSIIDLTIISNRRNKFVKLNIEKFL